MKQIALLLSGLIFVLILGACTPPPTTASLSDTPTPVPTDTPTPAPTDTSEIVLDPGFNILLDTEGQVLLKRSAWSDYHSTAFGANLERGDLLKLAQDARATVLCDGLTTWQVPAGAPVGLTNGCPPPLEKILVSGAVGIASTVRGANDPLIPYIISPRMTKLINNTPTLRWNDTGAASYTVQVRGSDLSWSQVGVTKSELVYPGDPALKPGVSYLLVVIEESDQNPKSSQDEGRAGLGFSLLGEEGADQVKAHSGQIAGLGLSDEAQAFVQAQLFVGRGLTAEAIELLEALIQKGSQQVIVYQTLADRYAQIGLTLQAEPRYLEAIKLAEAQGNVEAMAASQAGLGEVYVTLGKNDEAIRWLTRAQAGYEALGDTQSASELEERVAELNP
ncbi:MAG: tetratricopeptide repeat protein [Anaerolineae bacterium]|nr:tetratricopeptide repeat protein [Anaerolineae bacterium]